MLAVILDRFQQLCLGLFAKTGQLSSLPLLADTLEILHGCDPELVMERLDLLGSQSLKLEELKDPLGEGALQLLVVCEAARGHQFRHLLGDRLPDPLDLTKALLLDQRLDRLTQGLQSPGGVGVSTDLERVLPLQFEQLGDML